MNELPERDSVMMQYCYRFGNFPRYVHDFDDEKFIHVLKTCIDQGKRYEDIFLSKEERDELDRLRNDPNILFDG